MYNGNYNHMKESSYSRVFVPLDTHQKRRRSLYYTVRAANAD